MKITSILGCHSVGRINEYKSIQCEDIKLAAKKERFECQIYNPLKQRGDKRYLDFEFFITGIEEMRLMALYITKIHPSHRAGQFLKNWNKKAKMFCQNAGINHLNQIPKDFAKLLKLDDAKSYTGQSWRRSTATALVDKGATQKQLKRAGRWHSDSAPEKYIENSELAKHFVAMSISLKPLDSKAA